LAVGSFGLAQRDLLIGVNRAVQSEEFKRGAVELPESRGRLAPQLSRELRISAAGRREPRPVNTTWELSTLQAGGENSLKIGALDLAGDNPNVGLNKLRFLQKAQQFDFAEA
jgi:hypothetical protein